MTRKKSLILIGLLSLASLIAVTTVIAQQRKPRPATRPSSPTATQGKSKEKRSVGDKLCIDVWDDDGEFCGIIEVVAEERYKVQITSVYNKSCFLCSDFLSAKSCSGDRTIRVRGYKGQDEVGVGNYVWIPKYCDGEGERLKERKRRDEEARRNEESRLAEVKRTEEARLVEIRKAESKKEVEVARANLKSAIEAANSLSPAIKNSVGMELVLIKPGEFRMGSDDGDSDEKPAHEVFIYKPFYMGKYEVTQAQWRRVMGYSFSHFNGDNLPVENVSFDEAKKFCGKLSQMTGDEYRLPSEAEWEYASRAGSTGNYAGSLDAMAWYESNSGGKTHPVGQKQPNTWGLYDMHGNVNEWVEDRYGERYYSISPTIDPLGPSSGSKRGGRGGGWSSNAANCRSACRNAGAPDTHSMDLGFRVVRIGR